MVRGSPSEKWSPLWLLPVQDAGGVLQLPTFQQGCCTLHTWFGDPRVALLIWTPSQWQFRLQHGAGEAQELFWSKGCSGKAAWLLHPVAPRRANSSCLQSCSWQLSIEELYQQGHRAPHQLSCVHSSSRGRLWGQVPGDPTGDAVGHGPTPPVWLRPEQRQPGCRRAPASRSLRTCSWHRAAIYNQPAV